MITHSLIAHIAAALVAPWNPPAHIPVVVEYLGPNTVLPLASMLAAAIGVILMFWRYIAATLRKGFQALFRRNPSASGPEGDSPVDTEIPK